jgi:hypothetical protein
MKMVRLAVCQKRRELAKTEPAAVGSRDTCVGEISRSQQLKIFQIDFDRVALHDVFQGHHDTETILVPDHDTFQPGKSTRPDANPLPNRQQRVWLRVP